MSEAANDAFRGMAENLARAVEASGRAGGSSTAQAEGVALRAGDGGGTLPPMDAVDAKIAASEARSETKLEKAMGEVRVEFTALRGDIRELTAKSASKGTVVITGISLFFGMAGLLAAFLAYGGDQFGRGADVTTIARTAAREAIQEQARAQPPPAPPK